jgi:uncharacterized protein (DUF983 family)
MNTQADTSLPVPGVATLMWRGFCQNCPRCGKSRLFRKFLKQTDQCAVCEQKLGHIRADDFPPYLTMIVVGHIIVPMVLISERKLHLSITQQLSIWLPVTAILTFWFLPRLKGLIIGLMLHLGLHGEEHQ